MADHDEVSDLYRSEDGGRTWEGAAGECLVDTIAGAATLDDGDVVLLGEGRVWWRAVGGEVWAPVELAFTATTMAGGERLYLGGADGVWTVDNDGAAALVLEGSVTSLHAGDGGVVALLAGEVAYTRGGDWVVVDAPEGARSATLDEAHVFVGTDAGDVLRLGDDGWIGCGDSPLRDANPAHPQVVRLATDGATLVLAHADAGPALSTDACATWTADPAPADLVWRDDLTDDDYYDFTELDEAFTALGVGGDRVVVGTYDGAATRINGAWQKQPLKGADYPRGVAFSTTFAEDGLALVAAYGCGIERAFEAGVRWDCPGVGLDLPGAQAIAVPSDAEGLVPAYALSNRVPFRSDNGGASWAPIAGTFGPAHHLAAGPGGRVWLFPVQQIEGGAPGDLLRSDDRGATWSGVPGLSVVGEHVVRGLVDAGSRVIAFTGDKDDTTAEAVYLSTDGDTFLAILEASEFADVATGGDVIVAVGPGGIDVGVADGAAWVWTHPSDEPTRRVVVTSDGTLIAATRTQRLLRSDDGRTWEDLGAALPGQIEALAAHPDFAAHPELVAMTPAGAFRVDEDGTVSRWMGLQQADDQSHYSAFVAYDPPSNDVSREGAHLGTVHALPAGTVATVWLRGPSIELIGAIDGVAELELRVDGVVTGVTASDAMPIGGVLASAEVGDGPHLVELEVIAGEGVYLDAARGTEASAPLGWAPRDAAASEAPPPCGCGSPGAPLRWWMLAPLLGLVRRRLPGRCGAWTTGGSRCGSPAYLEREPGGSHHGAGAGARPPGRHQKEETWQDPSTRST